jgi:hypothetical protein
VVGRLRYSQEFITIDVASRWLRDHRVKLVYSPTVVRAARARGCGSDPADRERMESLADVLVGYAGLQRIPFSDGPFAGQRQSFPAGEVPERVTLPDETGCIASYLLETGAHGRHNYRYYPDPLV